MEKKLLFILNPKAGQKRANRLLTEILEIFQKAGYECTVRLTMKCGDGRRLVRKYGKEADLIVCAGGDGTLNEVIDGITHEKIDVPIGYIPAGSTNDLANSLGLSADILQAARDIVTGEEKKLDVCSFNGRNYTYVASCGVFTAASYETAQQAKNMLGRLAYLMAGMRDLSQVKPFEMRVETAEGEVLEGRYIFAAFSNSTSIGGVLEMDPDIVDLNDGLFEVLLIQAPDTIPDLTMIVSELLNQQYDSEHLSFAKTSKALIRMDGSVRWTLDGEMQKGAGEIVIESVHDAYRLIIAQKE